MVNLSRREWIALGTGALASAAWTGVARAQSQARTFTPQSGPWRTFEVTTTVQILNTKGTTQLWIPLPSVNGEFQQSLDQQWSGNAKITRVLSDLRYGASMLGNKPRAHP
jgi:hypothetical protein